MKEDKIDRELIRFYKFLFFMMAYIMPLVYIGILVLLQSFEGPLIYNYENYFYLFSTYVSHIILIFGIITALAIILTYKFFIPYIQKCENKSRILPLNQYLLAFGSIIPITFGLVIGAIGYSDFIIDWFSAIPFIAVGLVYGSYLYRKVILPSLEKYESLTIFINEQEIADRNLIRSTKRILFMITYMIPPIFIVILVMLQDTKKALPYNYENYFYLFSTNLSFIILIFGIVSALVIILTYKFLIPYIQKCEDKSRILSLNLLLILFGSTIINTLGLLIGVLGYSDYNIIDWFIIVPFIIVGSTSGIYLRRKVIPLSIKRYESLVY